MYRVGVVGFPNVGKTSLFNALTGLDAAVGAFPYTTTEPHVGVAKVPDVGLEELANLEGSARTVHTALEVLDLPALGRPGRAGLGTQYLARLREMDALCVVLRAFDDPSVPADESGIDPVRQAEELSLELALADHEVLRRRLAHVRKEAAGDSGVRQTAEALADAVDLLDAGVPLRSREWSAAAVALFRDMAPLSLKPVVWVVNVAEEVDPARAGDAVTAVVPEGDAVTVLSARLEAEAAQLTDEERAEVFEGLGLGEGALRTVVTAVYEALQLITFYTANPRESHAWTIARGTSARGAAGKVHSDMERGFIRAEVAPVGDVVEAGGWDAAKAGGLVRVEGQEYQVHDGDVLLVRFSV